MPRCQATADFFRARLDHMIDLQHSLAVLSSRMPWQAIEAACAQQFSRAARADVAMPELDLFGEQVVLSPRASAAGRPRVPLRIMIGLLYLKHAFNESDESVVARWAENPYWQYFCGLAYFEPRLPCDSTTLIKFRGLLGEQGCEEILAQTLNAAVSMRLIAPAAFERVIVDTTVQEKAITHPTDSKLLETARAKLVEAAVDAGIALKQTFAKEGKTLRFKAARYAHARQFKRMRGRIKRQRTIVGRLVREIGRKASVISPLLQSLLDKATRLIEQSKHAAAARTSEGKVAPKLYSWHEPQVECIAKGKSKTPYEFGVKTSIASTHEGNLIVGARAFHGNPYDGHTLAEQIEQSTLLMQDIEQANDASTPKPKIVFADLGYRGQDTANPSVRIIHRGKFFSLSAKERRQLKRRQAIEPIIGHLKSDHRLNRCHLKGEAGDKLHVILCAAGYNIAWLLREIAKKGVLHAFFWVKRMSALASALKSVCVRRALSAGSVCAAMRTPMVTWP